MKDENNSSIGERGALPSMAALLAFECAAAHSSFANAAKDLGRTPSAISHAIKDIEDHLGVTLFVRTGRSVALTEVGTSYLAAIQLSLDQIRKASADLRRSRNSNVIRISALPFFTSAVLLPNIGKFEAQFPHYDLRLETSSAYADLMNDEVDIALRFGRNHSQDLFCKPLVRVKGHPIASPQYLKQAPELQSVEDLSAHTLIHIRQNPNAWGDWAKSHGVTGFQGQRELTFESILGALDAVKSGRGVALAMVPLIETYPGFGTDFLPVLGPSQGEGIAYNFVCRKSVVADRKIERTLRWLESILSPNGSSSHGLS